LVSDWSARTTQRIDDLGMFAVAVTLLALLGVSWLRRRGNILARSLPAPGESTADLAGTHDTAPAPGAAR
jgi:hypothetical protein